jgi:hypothetical protein
MIKHYNAPKAEKGKSPRRRAAEIAAGLTAAASTIVGCSVGNEAAPAPTVTVTAPAEAALGASSPDTITDEQRRIAADIALENLGTLLEKFGGESSQSYDSEKNTLSVYAMYNDDLMFLDTLPGTETFENGDMRRNYSYAYVTTKRTVDGTWETSISARDFYPIITKSGELLDDKDISAEEGRYQSSESDDTVVVRSSTVDEIADL